MNQVRSILSILLLSAIFLMLFACSDLQSEYYEIHVTVVGDSIVYYIDPTDGKDTLSERTLGEGDTLFIYLYESQEGVEFGYEQFFTTIQSRFVERSVKNDKLYVRANSEIDNLITQYFIDRDAWQASQS